MRGLWKCGLCYLLAALMVLDPNVIQQWLARAQQPAKPAGQEPPDTKEAPAKLTPEQLKKIADEMERGFKALEAAEKEIPRDTFDPKAIVKKVGEDPVKLFEWVRDNTYWVPYRGGLRGPIGVLMDRLGSSCDRSFLLAELLRVAGHTVRLARAELTDEQAKALLPKLRPVPADPMPRQKTDKKETDALIEKYAKEYKLDAAELRANLEKSSLQAAKLAEEVVQRVAEQTPMLLKAVGKPDEKTVKSQREKEAADQLKSVKDHWFVQRKDGNAWTALDPLLPNAAPGVAVAEAKSQVEFDPKAVKFALDSKDCHEVKINVVIEQWTKQGGLKEKTVLSHTLRPFEVFGETLALRHIPMSWPKDLNLFEEKEPLKKLNGVVLAQDEWLPVLTVGSNMVMQSSFTDAGDTDADAPARLAAPLDAKALGTGVGGILGSGKIGKQGAGGREKPKSDGRLTAEWIDYEVCAPGRAAHTIRRELFDQLGPAARSQKLFGPPMLVEAQRLERGLTFLGQTRILTLPCELSSSFVDRLTATNMLAQQSVLMELASRPDWMKQKDAVEKVARLPDMAQRLYSLALARSEWSRRRGDVYLDGVNVFSEHVNIHSGPNGELSICQGIDIVANEIGVHARPGIDRFSIRLEHGVLATNAEAVLMGGCGRVENTAELFASAAGQGASWQMVRSSHEPAWTNLDLPKDVRARVEQDLAAGYAVLVPPKAVQTDGRSVIGWWRVDPRTGETLGIGERGWGGAAEWKMILLVAAATVLVLWAVVLWVCMQAPGYRPYFSACTSRPPPGGSAGGTWMQTITNSIQRTVN